MHGPAGTAAVQPDELEMSKRGEVAGYEPAQHASETQSLHRVAHTKEVIVCNDDRPWGNQIRYCQDQQAARMS